MEFTIHVKGLDALASAITLLAQTIGQAPMQTSPQPLGASQPVVPIQVPTQAPIMAPLPNPVQVQAPVIPVTPPAPVQAQPMQAPTSPIQIPTSHVAQEFTLDQISLAMAGLIDAGKMQVITEIMKSFNVAAITQLSKDQYPALVVKLREVGAQL